MPRRGGGRSFSSSPPRTAYSSGFTPRQTQLPPKPAPKPSAPTPQHPGLMKQMAATAGGVVAGNMIAGALMGPRERDVVIVTNEQQQEKKPEDPCAKEISELLNCIQMIQQTNENINVCEGFRIKLGKCRDKYGDPYGEQRQ